MTIDLDELERLARYNSGTVEMRPHDVCALIAKAREADALTARVAGLEAAGDRLRRSLRDAVAWPDEYQDDFDAWDALRNEAT